MRKCDFCKSKAKYVSNVHNDYLTFVCEEHYNKYPLPTYTLIPVEPLRKCTICGNKKPVECFYGKRAECKECNAFARKKVRMRR